MCWTCRTLLSGLVLLTFSCVVRGYCQWPCDVSTCNKSITIDQCPYGLSLDICRCCDICSRGVGEDCGGGWNFAGECGDQLVCTLDLDAAMRVAGTCLPKDAEACSLPPETGPCRASIPMWYFSPTLASCQQFTYGGCGGNNNRFLSQEACVGVCTYSSSGEKAEGTYDQMQHFMDIMRHQGYMEDNDDKI